MIVIWSKAKENLTSMTPEYLLRFALWLHARLKSGTVVVVFKKKDDSIRTMCCTLKDEHIPKEAISKLDHTTKMFPGDSTIVWDIDSGAWRTITYDRIDVIRVETDVRGDLKWESIPTV